MDMKRLFLFSWKKLGLAVLAFLVAVILHNLVSAWLNTEEALFFILASRRMNCACAKIHQPPVERMQDRPVGVPLLRVAMPQPA